MEELKRKIICAVLLFSQSVFAESISSFLPNDARSSHFKKDPLVAKKHGLKGKLTHSAVIPDPTKTGKSGGTKTKIEARSKNIPTDDNPKSLKDFIKKTTVDGNLRSYYFTRTFGNPQQANQASFSLGGALNVKTASIYHFSVGLTYYAANSFGLNNSNFNKIDSTLPGRSVNVLGQAYLQYKIPTWLVRGGRQLISTPWVGPSDVRMIPSTYEAILTTVTPYPGFDMTAFRQTRFKSHTAKIFDATNLYDPRNYGGTGFKAFGDENILGTLAGGIRYQCKEFVPQIWYYQFYDFSKLLYADMSYIFKNTTPFHPLVGMQLAKEWGDGKNLLQVIGQGKSVASLFGILGGLEIYDGSLTLGYDEIPKRAGAYMNGDIISPYTSGYATDPLYTTSMMSGLVEKAAGQAWKVSGTYHFFDEQLRFITTYAKYYTAPFYNNTSETNIDVTYTFKKCLLKGLSLRNRWGVLNGNKSQGRFIYNRVMIQYDFS